MQTIRSATIKEIFTAWAQSEAKRFTYPKSLKNFDLFIQHMKNRAPIYGDILSAIPKDCSLVEVKKSDLKNISFLRQVDEKGKEEDPSDVKKYIKKHTQELNGNVCEDNWNFIAVKRPDKPKMVIIDGLHRFADWVCQLDCEPEPYEILKTVNSIKGYIIETKYKLKEFEF